MRRVIIESPYRANTAARIFTHTEFARWCMLDCIKRGEAPFASHLAYTNLLDDQNPVERAQAIAMGLSWAEVADATIVYTDLGITEGMQQGIDAATAANRPIEYRQLSKHTPHGSL